MGWWDETYQILVIMSGLSSLVYGSSISELEISGGLILSLPYWPSHWPLFCGPLCLGGKAAPLDGTFPLLRKA